MQGGVILIMRANETPFSICHPLWTNVQHFSTELPDIRPVAGKPLLNAFFRLTFVTAKLPKLVSTEPDTEAKERVQQRPSAWPKMAENSVLPNGR